MPQFLICNSETTEAKAVPTTQSSKNLRRQGALLQ